MTIDLLFELILIAAMSLSFGAAARWLGGSVRSWGKTYRPRVIRFAIALAPVMAIFVLTTHVLVKSLIFPFLHQHGLARLPITPFVVPALLGVGGYLVVQTLLWLITANWGNRPVSPWFMQMFFEEVRQPVEGDRIGAALEKLKR